VSGGIVENEDGGTALPRHLAALIGALQGPADLAVNLDSYLTYPQTDDPVGGVATA
jgi:hypothetical protein